MPERAAAAAHPCAQTWGRYGQRGLSSPTVAQSTSNLPG
ncbi:hypothetical protein RC1_0956 [Rhodospirillum centenum SW]|uniref:Uncharacterized protein n=1 Tax=Rhodospirillum centenum (strain ATCC 51521 / SW) TaxID=414684 RepID=B6ISE6_RHOCS|nr:hypothetical protein RC1_0956 [Rhodospirillum centenum SW]